MPYSFTSTTPEFPPVNCLQTRDNLRFGACYFLSRRIWNTLFLFDSGLECTLSPTGTSVSHWRSLFVSLDPRTPVDSWPCHVSFFHNNSRFAVESSFFLNSLQSSFVQRGQNVFAFFCLTRSPFRNLRPLSSHALSFLWVAERVNEIVDQSVLKGWIWSSIHIRGHHFQFWRW